MYSDDIDVLRRRKRGVTATFSAMERKSTKMALLVIEGKIKYMLSASRDVWSIGSQIMADNYTFDIVKKFVFLCFAVTNKNNVGLEIKSMISIDYGSPKSFNRFFNGQVSTTY